MFIFETEYRVRYADVDQMGYVYYGNYSKIYEIGRVEALRSWGLSYKAIEATGIIMPVYENKSRYLQPATYDELLTIRVIIRQLPTVRMIFEYEIFGENKSLIHTGETTLVFTRIGDNKIVKIPASIIEKLTPFWE